MSIALHKSMTMAEFLIWEHQQELRWEFDGFEPVAMTGGSLEYSAIERNLMASLAIRLRGKSCQPYTGNLKIGVAGAMRYPDAFVVCTPQPPGTYVVTDPVVVFEILSPSTASTDIGIKNEQYRDTPSIQRYVILTQDRQRATIFARDGGDWVGHITSGNAILRMPEIGIDLPLAELYAGLDFASGAATV
jgi:Uma2 family endonuclease